MRGEERPKETVDAEKQKQSERVAIVSRTLAGTPYECTSLEQVSGGFMNHTYRPQLAQALPDGSTTAIIKYSEEYVTSAGGIKYPPSRCVRYPHTLSFSVLPFAVTGQETNLLSFTAR